MKNSLLLIPIALLCAVLLLSQEIQEVYAVTFLIITPVGGGLVATADCTDITAGDDIVWLNCSDTSKLFAISDTNHAVLANITTSGALNTLQVAQSGSSVFLNDPTANRITKYTYSANTITQIGILNSPCDSITDFNYDTSGFLWIICFTTDQIVRINPQTLTVDTQASTDSCSEPDAVSYHAGDDIGILHCLNGGGADTIATFTIVSTTDISILDTEVTTSGSVNVMIDGAHNTVLAPSTSIMSVWTYTTPTGLLTLTQAIAGNTFDQCDIEYFGVLSTQNVFAVCEAYINPNTLITGFMINTTGTSQIMNNALVYSDASAIGFDPHDSGSGTNQPVWYISANSNNQKYIRIDDVREAEDTTPEPPEPPDGDDGDGNSPENTDTDGDTIPNSEDDDIDGDTIPNSQDPDIDGDGIPNAEDDTPCGSNSCIVNNTCVFGTAVQCMSNDGAIGDGGTFVIDGIERIICSVGIVDCEEDSDMRTNGVGLLLTVIALMVMIGMFWVTTRGDLGAIPMFIWFIAVLGVVGFAVIAEIIDVTFLIISVVAMIALATAKLRGLFGGEFK